jgi:hypothetical protein
MERAPKSVCDDLDERIACATAQLTYLRLKWNKAVDNKTKFTQRLVALAEKTLRKYKELQGNEENMKELRAKFTESQEEIKTIVAEVDADIKLNEEHKQMDEATLRERLEAQRSRITALEEELARLKAEKLVDAVAKPSSFVPMAVEKVVSKTPDEVTTDENGTTDGGSTTDDNAPIAKLPRRKRPQSQVVSDMGDVSLPRRKRRRAQVASDTDDGSVGSVSPIVVKDDVATPVEEKKAAALPTAKLSAEAGASKPKTKRPRSDKAAKATVSDGAAAAPKKAKAPTKTTKYSDLYAASLVEDGTQLYGSQDIDEFFDKYGKK